MNVSLVNATTSTQKGKKIGTIAGFGVGGVYVAKNGKDILSIYVKNHKIKTFY